MKLVLVALVLVVVATLVILGVFGLLGIKLAGPLPGSRSGGEVVPPAPPRPGSPPSTEPDRADRADSTEPHVLEASRRALSLLADGRTDFRLAVLSGRPVLAGARMGHLIDLGRWTAPLPEAQELLGRLPAEERAALTAWYASEAAVPLRSVMPLVAGHLYLAGSGDMGDGRGSALALLLVHAIEGEGAACRVTLARRLLRHERHAARAQVSLARWAREEKGRRTGYARLSPEAAHGDPVKSTYSLVYGTRDHRDAFLHAWDLRYGREGHLLEVRPWALGQGAIAPLVGGVEPWSVPDEMWVTAIEVVPETRFAVRLQDELTDLLAELTVSEIDAQGELAFAWRILEDGTELTRNPPNVDGQVLGHGGEPEGDALVWVDGPGLEHLPFALRAARTRADGGFVLPRPPQGDTPVMITAASATGAATREVAASEQAVQVVLEPAWRVTLAWQTDGAPPIALRLNADTLALGGFTPDALAVPQLPHGRFEVLARGAFWSGATIRDAREESGELTLPLVLEQRSALRIVLVDAASGFVSAGSAKIDVALAGSHFEHRCERGETFFMGLPAGRATVTVRAGRAAPITRETELRAGELFELELDVPPVDPR